MPADENASEVGIAKPVLAKLLDVDIHYAVVCNHCPNQLSLTDVGYFNDHKLVHKCTYTVVPFTGEYSKVLLNPL